MANKLANRFRNLSNPQENGLIQLFLKIAVLCFFLPLDAFTRPPEMAKDLVGLAKLKLVNLKESAAKAVLIVVFFMEIRGRSPVIRLALAAGFFFLGILFAMAMGDFLTRGWK